MIEYAKQILDFAAEEADIKESEYREYKGNYYVDKESILNIKNQLK